MFRSKWQITILVLIGFTIIGVIDYLTGVEIRLFPLYFLPLSLAAWSLGSIGAVIAVILATFIWFLSNYYAGMVYSLNWIWVFNLFAQFLAFSTVAYLLSLSRILLDREKRLSSTDNLTGLSNARSFYKDVQYVLQVCERHQRPLTLAYLDLDNFKSINDSQGHAKGDETLKDVAKILKETLRTTDLIARMGGDEFAICLPEAPENVVKPILDRLREKLFTKLPQVPIKVSASIGAIYWTKPLNNIDELVSAADQLMYQVKKTGKNRVELVVNK